MVTAALLTYYIVCTAITHTIEVTYVVSTNNALLDLDSNIFNVNRNNMQVYTKFVTNNSTISANIDAYVGGVYMQDFFNSSDKTRTQTFIPAVLCSSLYPDDQSLPSDDVYCPQTDRI